MDLQHFEESIRKLQLRPEMIISTAEYCLKNNKNNEEQIAKIIEKEYSGSHIDQKLAMLLLISQIFIESNKKHNKSFFKTLSLRTRLIISDLTSSDVLKVDKQIANTLEKWANEGMFHANFMKKLKEAAGPSYERLQRIQEKQLSQKLKYGKTFLIQIADLKSVTPCYKVYQNYCNYRRIESELSTFYNQFKKIEGDNPTPEAIQRAEELSKIATEHEERLIKLVEECQTNFKLIQTACKKEYQKLPEGVKAHVNTL